MNPVRFQEIAHRFPHLKVLVIGDLILDEFIWGRVRRISPEAPVPVVEVTRETYYPGGAANVARNLSEYTPHIHLLGLTGTDSHGCRLRQLLEEDGIHLSALLQDPQTPTIVKTRIIAHHQQMVRVDREKKTALTPEQMADALARLDQLLPDLDGVIIEDYHKGLITQELIDAVIQRARAAGKIVTIDPNPGNPLNWHDVTTIKPNRSEAFAMAGRPPADPVDPPIEDRALLEVGAELMQRWSAESLLVTLSEHGIMLFRRNEPPIHLPTRAREVFDVSGAGDTAIALYTLALCAGATPPEAAELANRASGIVVGKLGTATVSLQELADSVASHNTGAAQS